MYLKGMELVAQYKLFYSLVTYLDFWAGDKFKNSETFVRSYNNKNNDTF